MEMDWLEEALQDCMWDDEYAKEEARDEYNELCRTD